MISYIKARIEIEASNESQILGEAVDSYILPQLEGLNSKDVDNIKKFFEEMDLMECISDKFDELKLNL